MNFILKLSLLLVFFSYLENANAEVSFNCAQSKIGNLKNKELKIKINSNLKVSEKKIDVEINGEKFSGTWKKVFDEMLNENIDVIQGEKKINGLIYFFSYGPKRKILGYEIIDENNQNNSQFGLLGCKSS